MRYIIPLVDGVYTEGDASITTEGTRNESSSHKIIVALNGAPSDGKLTIQYKRAGSNRWDYVDYTNLSEVEPQKIEISGVSSQFRFIVEGASGTGTAIISDTELGESITPYGLFGATGGMTPAEVGGSISQGKSATIPTGFNWPESLPDVIAYKSGNSYDCNIKPEDLIDFSQFTNVVYVDGDNGSNSNSGNSWAFAYLDIEEAVDRAISDATPTMILVKSGLFLRGAGISGFNQVKTLTSDVAIIAQNGRVKTIVSDSLSWSQNATYSNVYESSRSTVTSVINLNQVDKNGAPFVYEKAASLSECASNPGSWFTDDSTVYVHAQGGGVVSDYNASAIIRSACASIVTDYNFYIRGFDFFGGRYGAFDLTGGADSVVVTDDCRAMFSVDGTFSTPAYTDGFNVNSSGLFAAFDCESSFNSKDGFNFSANSGVSGYSLTVNCRGYKNGEGYTGSTSCNGITFHLGHIGIDIGSEWLGSYGANSAHVNNGTQYYGFGVTSGDSGGDVLHGGGIDYGAFGAWSGAAEMWLDSCQSVGSIIGVKASGTAKAYVREFSGTGSLDGNVESY